MQPVNIVIAVDTIAALSQGTLMGNAYLTDDSCYSQDKGTTQLKTVCYRGQPVQWKVLAVDVQSPAVIAGITILRDGAVPFESGIDPHPDRYIQPRWCTWTGRVPCGIGLGLYHYRLAIQMGTGQRSVMFINSPALDVVA
ncbi:MAG: hypothetical protein H7Z12_17955 [Rhodospirillaceae bacterium]|nr:hypothetical protein [Rhodospirillales bacterium]